MTKKKQKLELTWIGKDQRPKLEPRILIEDPEKSYHASERRSEDDIFDNILIHGDNLLALKALEQDYAGRVKCIYIDPPFNINASTPYFDDGLEHSQWLNLMRPRLELLRMLLSPDGMIFVHIDDEEMPYLTVLMDQIFGRSNRINIIAVKMSEPSGVKMAHTEKRLPKLKEFILVYSGGGCHTINVEKVPIGTWNEEYKTLLLGIDKHQIDIIKKKISVKPASKFDVEECNRLLRNTTTISLAEYFKNNGISKKDQKNFSFENAWRIIQAVGSNSVFNMAKSQRLRRQEIAAVLSSTGIIYLYKTNFDENAKQPRIQVIFADENLTQNPGDFWQDIRTTGGVGKEGGVLFPNSKKPESLLKRIVGLSTGPGDTVLDSFAGSGTTGAVAHKMKRKWIMVEMGDHCETHIIPRMKNIINGQDRTGITEKVSWSGGGGFRYFHLAPSLLEQDKYGNWVISKDYKPEMLAEAMCKHMGFTYAPSQNPDEYWNHGYSTETDFIFVTTQNLTRPALAKIAEDVGPDRSLLVCCKAFNANSDAFENLTIKKIPHAVLKKCEWGRDDYSLNVANLPMAAEDAPHPSLPPDDLPLFASDDTGEEA